MSIRIGRVLGFAAGVVLGIVTAVLLAIIVRPVFDSPIDPRSREGIERTVIAAVMSLVVGAATAFMPPAPSKSTFWTQVAILGPLGVVGALTGNYVGIVWGFVMTPALFLGRLLAQRRRDYHPNRGSDLGSEVDVPSSVSSPKPYSTASSDVKH